jgi:hypothetical protein
MLGSTVLETAIGLVFVYLVFSLIASGIAEYISALFDRRGTHLKHVLFNLFDNDDPQGRTMLNLFVAHPMVQALNATDWKPKFQTASERLGQAKEEFDLAKSKWNAASAAVTTAGAARVAARNAEAEAKQALADAQSVKTALQTFTPLNATSSAALLKAVETAEERIKVAQSAAAAADAATKAAIAAEQAVVRIRAPHATPLVATAPGLTPPAAGPAQGVDTTGGVTTADLDPPAAGAVPPASAPEVVPPDPKAATNVNLPARAASAVDGATKAAAAAKEAATRAKKAAAAAEKAKRGLDSDLIDLVDVPKYIPDRTFADVLIHVLTADDTMRALATNPESEEPAESPKDDGANTLWDRFGAAIRVVGGVASRLPDGDAKTNVNKAVAAVETTIHQAGKGAAEAVGIVGKLEKGTNDLLAVVAAVPDDALRLALEHEIQNSLRPLHALGQDILMLQRAGLTIAMMADSSIKTALTAFHAQAGEDLNAFKNSVGSWFNDVMDHATGWYKRNTQRILIVIAVVLCTFNNVDTVSLVGHLSSNTEMRTAAATEARGFLGMPDAPPIGKPAVPGDVPNAEEQKSQLALKYKSALEATKLPLWWTKAEWNKLWDEIESAQNVAEAANDATFPVPAGKSGKAIAAVKRFSISYGWILAKVTGLLISIMAVSMGAPFWFDILNKLVNIRLVGKRPDPTTVDPGAAPATAPSNSAPTTRATA